MGLENSSNRHDSCSCGTPTLHRVFRFAWENPSASRKDAARALKLSEVNVRVAFSRLKKRNLSRVCPECFHAVLLDGVCQSCGFEPPSPVLPIVARADCHSAVNSLHPGNLLGSEVDYGKIGFANHGLIMKRLVERNVEDTLIVGVKSEVENELKRTFPSEMITDEAGRLAIKEVIEFRAKYPGLASSKNVRKQLAKNVINRLRLLHPQLRNVTVLLPEVVV